MAIEAELRRRLSGTGLLADWSLRDANVPAGDDLPTDPVSDVVARARLAAILAQLDDATSDTVLSLLREVRDAAGASSSGGLTDLQLRAAPVPVETELGAAGPLATEVTLEAVRVLSVAVRDLLTAIRTEHALPEITEFTAAPVGTRTATEISAAITNTRARGMRLYLDVTAVAGTLPTLDVKLQTKDPLSGRWVDMANAAFPQINAVGTWVLVIYPGINQTTVGAVVRVSNVMSRTFRLVSTVAGTTPSFTFSVAGALLP